LVLGSYPDGRPAVSSPAAGKLSEGRLADRFGPSLRGAQSLHYEGAIPAGTVPEATFPRRSGIGPATFPK
jgi:hypothetical protein